jgi:HK97 family phage portal protein
LCRNIIADLLVFADAYIEIVWTGSQPVALYNQDSPTTTPVSDNHGNVSKYVQVSQYGERVEFEPHEIIHISLDSARPGVLGIAPMQAALHPIMCWLYAMGTGKEAFKKGLPPAIHVDHAAGYGDTKARTWRDKYFARNTGSKNIGAPIQTEGGATVKELQTGKISDVKMGKDQARDEILSTFGVPPAEAGVIEAGNLGGGTGDAQHRTFEVNTCGPISELVTEALTYSLAVAAFGITEWKLKFGEVDYRDSAAIEAIRDQRLRNGAWTLNKYRAAIGEPPVPGGDDAVLVDRQNLVLWRDLAQLSSANINAKNAKGAQSSPPGTLGADGQQHDDQNDDGQGGSQQQANANQPGMPGGQQGGKGKNAKAKPGKTPREALRRAQMAAFQESFGRALATMPAVTEADKPVADQVYDQLSTNFPADAIGWVRDADWSGPHPVPVEQVDQSNRSEWAAAHEPDRVDKARRKLRKRLADGGHPKPVVLVRTPGSDNDVVADGHHRVEAVLQENEPTVWAYVGRVASKTGDWDTMHSSQLEGANR